MGLFNDMLKDSESLFLNHIALDYDYQPKMVPFREMQQKKIANCIKPLFNDMNGRNILIHGKPGVGKTVASKNVLNELEDQTDDIIPIYINCWQKNTIYKIAVYLCEELGYTLTHNKKSNELFEIATKILNKKSAVFVFDEVDKLDDIDVLYLVLEKIYRKSIILITNYKEWIDNLDMRIKSRLLPEIISFPPYTSEETRGILKERIKYAFVSGVWEDEAFDIVANKTYDVTDIRVGLHIMKEAALSAEERALKKIEKQDVKKALDKLDEYSINDGDKLEIDAKDVLEIVKKNSGERIGDLYKKYQKIGGTRSYKSFQRNIKKLQDAKFVKLEKASGEGGNTTLIKYIGQEIKKLTDF